MAVGLELADRLEAGGALRACRPEDSPALIPAKGEEEQLQLVDDERAGLLDDSAVAKEVSTSGEDSAPIDFRTIFTEMKLQGRLAGPLGANLLMGGLMQNVTLAFAARYGTDVMAASALSGSITFMFGRLPMIGLSCALDTLASQAFGAGQLDSLAVIWQRTVAFIGLHALGLTALVLSIPHLLPLLGWDPGLSANIAAYTTALAPSILLNVISRPINRILVAQKITAPQAYISAAVLLLHCLVNYLLVVVLKCGFVAVAAAQSLSELATALLMAAYVIFGGRLYCTLGRGLSSQAFKEWRAFGRIAYPACWMECSEAWVWGSMSVAAGLLPNATQAVAAISLAFTLANNMFFLYLAQSLACSTRVGNSLGAGMARQARVAMLAARGWVPVTWLASSFLFCEPHVRSLLLWLYTDGTDKELIRHVHILLSMMVALNLVDGTQLVMTGAIQGLGRQKVGFRINVFSFYCVGIPIAYTLAFGLGVGVEGLYTGLICGSAVQAACYTVYTSRVDWDAEARATSSRLRALAASAGGDCEGAHP